MKPILPFDSTFKKLLAQHPDLRPFLEKIRLRYRKKSALTGMMKLGQGLSAQELEGLHALFGMRAVTVSKSNEVRVSFDRYFKTMKPTLIEEWVDGLHLCLNVPRNDAAAEKRYLRREAELLLERLQLAFPELSTVHDLLTTEKVKISRLISRSPEAPAMYFKAAEITMFLRTNRDPVTFSDLGARFCNDSKALRSTELSRLIASWLLLMEQEEGIWKGSDEKVWNRHHVVRDRLSVQATLFGPLLYEKDNHTYDWIYSLWKAGEPATLSWANIQGIDRMYAAENAWPDGELITCENEAPFGRMIRECRPGILLYTSGFPNDAVLSLYRLIASEADSRMHWGDSDLAGLRIAAMFHAIHPVRLWRCDLANLQQHKEFLIHIPEGEKKHIDQFLIKNPDFPFAQELRFTLEHGWLEQESRRESAAEK